jgi:hypothetical protein
MLIIRGSFCSSEVSFYLQRQGLKNWKAHVDWMSSDRIPKMILKYEPKGKRNLGRPLKRWKDSIL